LTLFHQTVRQSSPTIPPGFFCFLSKKKKSTEFFFSSHVDLKKT